MAPLPCSLHLWPTPPCRWCIWPVGVQPGSSTTLATSSYSCPAGLFFGGLNGCRLEANKLTMLAALSHGGVSGTTSIDYCGRPCRSTPAQILRPVSAQPQSQWSRCLGCATCSNGCSREIPQVPLHCHCQLPAVHCKEHQVRLTLESRRQCGPQASSDDLACMMLHNLMALEVG